MIKLEKTFVSGEGGFSTDPLTYTQLARSETTAIYERSRNGVPKDYEVFRIKILPKGTKVFQTVTEDDQEKYPGTSQFGFIAWSYNNRARAMKAYEDLTKEAAGAAEEEAKPAKAVVVPVGEFSTIELAEKNGIQYATASIFMKDALSTNKIKFVREERRNVKGKPTKLYIKV